MSIAASRFTIMTTAFTWPRGPVDQTPREGLAAVALSLAVLAATAFAQTAIFIATGSVASSPT